MSAFNKPSQTYLKFLSIVGALREVPAFGVLEPIEERLLNVFAAVWHSGKQLTVLQAMQLDPDISSATVHRRLKTLALKGFIAFEQDIRDHRIKYLAPTDLSVQYFSQLGEALRKATKHSQT